MEIDELKDVFEAKLADLKVSLGNNIDSLKQHIDDRVSGLDKRFEEKITNFNKYYELKIKMLEQINSIRESGNDEKWKDHSKTHDDSKKTTIGIIISVFTLALSAIGFLIKTLFFSRS